MPSFADQSRLRQTLYRLEGACVDVSTGGRIGPIDWTLERGRRVRVRCAADAQWEAFVALLTGTRGPSAGVFEEVRPVRVQTDQNLRESLNLNQSLQDFLHSPDAPEMVWLDGRHRSLWVLLDAMGITPAMTRHPLKFQDAALQRKYWVLRFLLSQAELVIGREVFRDPDPQVQAALRRRWPDLPGALVAGESDVPLPGPAQEWVRFDAEGHFSSGAGDDPADEADAPADSPPQGPPPAGRDTP